MPRVTATIRTAPPGSQIPTGEPRRYNSRGYVKLRWKVGKMEYVEVLEHRIGADGRVVPSGVVVHHRNHDKTDNRPENLEYLTTKGHAQLHGEERRRISPEQVVELYESGLSTPKVAAIVGTHPARVWRILTAQGIPIRRSAWNKLDLDEDYIRERLRGGASVLGLAKEHGTSRAPIQRIKDEMLGKPALRRRSR